MGKRHAVNSNNHPVALFARGISGLAGVFRELKALEKSPPHSAVVLEWEIPLHELARYEHVECVCRHLCLIKRHTLPQLVVNVNVLGVNSVADEAQSDLGPRQCTRLWTRSGQTSN
ncbi:hypothetical protein BASA81_004801 [Batrachochytrium salamandrivorans]|nr:hypothetical protein BASA81_004801 [Batrachochytrium salamandrivorans]